MIIVPSSDLINRYDELTDRYLDKGEPIYITKDGCVHAVLLSIEEYERMSRDILVLKIDQGIRDAREGKVHSVDESKELISKKLGLDRE